MRFRRPADELHATVLAMAAFRQALIDALGRALEDGSTQP